MKKYSYATIAAIAVVLFNLQSCTKEKYEAPQTDKILVENISFKNGRMAFTNHKQMKAAMDELNSMDDSSFKNWETSTGFTSYSTYRQNIIIENYNNYLSMGENAPVKEYNKYVMPDWSLVTNQNMEYQIGDSIYFFIDNKIYGIKYEEEAKFKELKSQIASNSLKSYEQNFSVFEIRIDTLQPKSTSLKSTEVLDARYQKQWNTNGVDFKFVFESFYVNGGSFSTIYVQSKLEYWHRRSWPYRSYWDDAGESLYKSVSNFDIKNVSGESQLASQSYKNMNTYNNQYLVITSNSAYFCCGRYVKISGTMNSYTTCFTTNNSYTVTSDKLWEAYIY